MAGPAARRSTIGSALPVTLVAWLLILQLLLLAPVPAASARVPPKAVKKVYEFLRRKAARSGTKALIRKLSRNRRTDLLGSAAADDAGYIVIYNISVGATATQQNNVSGVVDVLNGVVWTTQCPALLPTVPCPSETCPNGSEYACGTNGTNTGNGGDRCEYVYTYGPGINTTGYLTNETLAVGSITGRAVFGCSDANSTVPLDGESGFIGFDRGPLSLVSQLSLNKFSYYLAPDEAGSSDSESVVFLGDTAVPQTRRGGRSTPLLRSTAFPDFYYVRQAHLHTG